MQHSAVATIFSEVLDIPLEEITDATSPENTPAWDSLGGMNLVVALEAAFGIRLTTKEILSMNSVGAAREFLRAKGIADA